MVFGDSDYGVTLTVNSGTLNGTCALTYWTTEGKIELASEDTATFKLVSYGDNTMVWYNGTITSRPSSYTTYGSTEDEDSFFFGWTALTITPSVLPEINLGVLWQYLYDGDFVGFFFNLLLYVFNVESIAVGFIAMMFLVALYLRTGSLLLLSIAWIIVGGALIGLMPAVAPLAVLFMGLGIAGLLYRLFRPSRN